MDSDTNNNPNRKTIARDYIKQNKLEPLLQDMLNMIVKDKAQEPVVYMVNKHL